MPNIKLKGQTGEVLTYEDVERVYFDSADEDGEVVYYTHGKIVEGVTIEPNFAKGDQVISVPDGSLVKEATIVKPAALVPENIRAGTNVAGVVGELIGDTEEVTVDLDMENGGQIITPTAEGKVMSKVVVTKPGTMLPENIANGVNIGGVVGEFIGDTEERTVDLNFPSGSVNEVILAEQTLDGFALDPTFGAFHFGVNPAPYELEADQEYTIVWDAAEFPRTAFAFTAADGASCVGIGNTLAVGGSDSGEPFCIVYDLTNSVLHYFSTEADTSHTAAIYHATEGNTDMVVTPSADGKVLSKVTITKPETLIPENIAKDVEIGGVVGTFAGSSYAITGQEIEPDFSDGDQTVTAGEDEAWNEVTVKKPESLVPENIAKGVDVGGVVGTLEKPLCVFTKCASAAFKITYKSAGQVNCAPSITIPLTSKITMVFARGEYITQSTTTNLNYPMVSLVAVPMVTNYTETNGESYKTITWPYSYNFTGYGSILSHMIVVFVVPGITLKTTDDGLVFYCDSTVVDIPSDGCFQDAKKITEADLQESKMTSLPQKAFYEASNLKKVTLPNTLLSVGSYAFKSCSQLSEIIIPESVTTIGSSTFGSCSSLSEIIIPESVTTIGDGAFWGCSKLSEITIPDGVVSIAGSLVRDCKSLTQITMPDGITTIGHYAFQNCTSLNQITIPAGVTSFGNSVFSGCTALQIVDCSSCTVVPTLGTTAFASCPSTLQIKVPAALYDEWIAATNWSTYASYIVAV